MRVRCERWLIYTEAKLGDIYTSMHIHLYCIQSFIEVMEGAPPKRQSIFATLNCLDKSNQIKSNHYFEPTPPTTFVTSDVAVTVTVLVTVEGGAVIVDAG